MPNIDPDIARIMAACKAGKIPAYRLLTRAGVSSASHWDWMNRGVEPLKRTVRRLDAALAELLREKLPADADPGPAATPEN